MTSFLSPFLSLLTCLFCLGVVFLATAEDETAPLPPPPRVPCWAFGNNAIENDLQQLFSVAQSRSVDAMTRYLLQPAARAGAEHKEGAVLAFGRRARIQNALTMQRAACNT